MLQADDHQLWLDFVNEILIRYDADNSWPLRILWTDKADFSLISTANSENCVHWADSNPYHVIALPLHEEKLTVWCWITTSSLVLTFLRTKDEGCYPAQPSSLVVLPRMKAVERDYCPRSTNVNGDECSL
ncbi:hypothetical protein AVEN_238758-1 [Araneus ventricosus]|uniref:Uncharacterized protein n=1 Tax=Araneus ventricosus TaxID=182803 RepID=A0A4Y2LGV9_ARAVE|nr:hypothetical protein AVEN_238758-1 [Araneus ventricosus]